jgi:hypothetical protein
VELNKPEIELLDKALESWEREDMGQAMMSSMVGAILSPKEDRGDYKAAMKVELAEAANSCQQKRIKATLLRAKLFQALARESEHVL